MYEPNSIFEKAKKHFYLGLEHISKENWAEAEMELKTSLEYIPNRISTITNLCATLIRVKKFHEANNLIERGQSLDANNPELIFNQGLLLAEAKEYEKALVSFDRSIELKPDYAEAWSNRGIALNDLKRYGDALASYVRAIEFKPDYVEAWNNRGAVLVDLNRYEEALSSFDKSIELNSGYVQAWSNRGVALNGLKRHEEALRSHERAIELKSDYAQAWNNLGVVLNDLKRHEEALRSHERAIELKSDFSEAWSNRGNALNDLKRHEEALRSHERAIELKPNSDFLLGDLVHTQMKICDWTNLDQRLRVLEGKILAGDKATRPFAVLGLFDSPKLQKQCAEIYAKDRLRLSCQLGLIIKKPKRSKIRIGYFSMDFREHPVSHLIAELFDVHDRSKFEIYGFSFGINTRDLMRKRLEKSFDNFLDVKHLSDLDIAHLSRQHEIDIAIDLGGHTQDSRPQIFAERVAPIQINYLGYPGTWGGEYMDYFIADKVAITSDNMQHFSEKIIFLPSCFQVNSRFRPIELSNSSKVDHGVPEGNFVFCCFNNIWKLTPEVFKTWVRILKETEDSILWLQNGGRTAQNNLTKEFELAGIRIDRVVFAERLPSLQDHLTRYKLADLFLDTFPYGAHTTASDSLWAGLPILTHAGKSFATRVAASLLNNIGIPELIARTQEEYFSLAVELAKNPEKLAPIRAKFERNRMNIPLFNTRIFAQHIESAYQAAYDRYHLGLPPDHICVDS